MKQRRSNTVHHLLSGLAVTALGVSVLCAQEGATVAPRPNAQPVNRVEGQGLTLELDMELLLRDQNVLGQQLSDPVWNFGNDPERQFVQLPFRITPGRTPMELTHTTVQFRGGRFLAWRIPAPQEQGRNGGFGAFPGRPPVPRAGDPFRGQGPGAFPGGPDGFPGGFAPGGAPNGAGVGAGDGGEAADETQLPPDAPRLARRIEIEPDGTLRWAIERGLPGAEVAAERSVYAFKIDPRLVAQHRPTQPRVTRNPNESPQEFATRRRQEQEKFREASVAFRELQDQIANLPETFAVRGVDTVWAVLEVRRSPTMEVGAMLPDGAWSIPLRHLESLRSLVQGRGGNLDATTLRDLQEVARSNQTRNLRLMATALQASGALAHVQPNDQLARLVMDVIRGPNQEGSHAMIEALALTLPPTGGTAALMQQSVPYMTPRLKLLALRSMLHMNTQDPAASRQSAMAITSALRDRDGADPADILSVALEIANRMPEHNQSLFVSAIQFEQLEGERLDRAIAAVISEAGIDPLAARWLDFKLLGASDVKLAQRTLELLARAETDQSTVRPAVSRVFDLVFGPAENEQGTLRVKLGARVLVESINHSLFRAIQHGEPRLRALAWDSLQAFTFSPEVAEAQRTATLQRRAMEASRRGTGSPAGGPDARPAVPQRRVQPGQPQPFDLYRTLVDAALTQPTMPPQVIAFLGSEGPSQRAADQLARLVLHGDEDTQRLAAHALQRSRQPIDQSLLAMDLKQRHTFTLNVYRHLRGEEPLVAGLMLDPSPQSPSARWFGTQLAMSGPPDPSQWHLAYGDEQPLLQLAGVNNQDLSAGAIAALVGSVGGDDGAARQFQETVSLLPDRSPASIALAWSEAKQTIFRERLAQTAGRYRLVIHVYDAATNNPAGAGANPARPGPPGAFPGGPGPFPPGPGFPDARFTPPGAQPVNNPQRTGNASDRPPVEGPPSLVIPLGSVRFVVEKDGIRFADLDLTLKLPESRFAIELTNPAELKVLPINQLANVPLEQVSQPLLLSPRAKGVWGGWLTLPDGRYLELLMQPE